MLILQGTLSILIVITVVGGIIGCAVSSILLDRTRKFKLIYSSLCVIQVIGLGTAILSNVFTKFIPTTAVGMFLVGFSFLGPMPVMFEFTAEVAYPIGAAMSGGSVIMLSHLIGSVVVRPFESNQLQSLIFSEAFDSMGSRWCLYSNLIITAAGALFCCFVQEDLRRLNKDKRMSVVGSEEDDMNPQKTE